MPSPYDLVSLTDLKAWLDITGTDDDDLLSRLITQISRAIMNVLARPSIIPGTYAETRDGGNEISHLLRHWPVNSISSCLVDGQIIPAAPALVGGAAAQTGYLLDPSEAQPPGRMQRLSLRHGLFTAGIQNVTITYSAGYQVAGEAARVPATPPYTIVVGAPFGAWASDGFVTNGNGGPLSPVSLAPAAGQYIASGGSYTFAAADAGTRVFLTYGYIPADLAACCMEWVAERYAYRSRIGQSSKSLGGQETMAFIVKSIPDFIAAALQPYRCVVAP